MLHFYNQSTDSVETQCLRLTPALAITRANIPCLVLAEDALSFVYFVPTVLFALQLLVPDEQLDMAALSITSTLPYEQMLSPSPDWLEYKHVDPTQPSCFPNSIYLRTTTPANLQSDDYPVDIFLHPQSFFNFDICQLDRSVTLASTLPSEFASIRFPTRPAFLDALIDTLLDPPSGLRVWKFTLQLDVYIGYILTYTLRAFPRVLPDGNLESEHAAVRDSLREENRPAFVSRVRGSMNWGDEMLRRREILKTTSRFKAALRPLPLNTARHRSLDATRTTLGMVESYHTSASQCITPTTSRNTLPFPSHFGHAGISRGPGRTLLAIVHHLTRLK